jgi:hypothetical protein
MTADDSARDDARRDSDGDAAEPDAQPQPPLDEEAAWRLIVENYGERPSVDGDDGPAAATGLTDPAENDEPTPPRPAEPERPAPGLFDRSYLDSLDRGRSDPPHRQDRRRDDPSQPADRDGEEQHFVPPEPPPVPRATPARRLAWCGLFLPPLLMLAAVVLGWTFPSWVALGLVAAFVGGFVFLVATMPRDGGDGWGDGAVV